MRRTELHSRLVFEFVSSLPCVLCPGMLDVNQEKTEIILALTFWFPFIGEEHRRVFYLRWSPLPYSGYFLAGKDHVKFIMRV